MNKVVDALLFNTEVELLSFRLKYLSGVVTDVWIAESANTFAGRPKRLLATENLTRLRSLTTARITVIEYGCSASVNRWENEWAARKQLLNLANSLDETDHLLLSDVDEIPSPAAIEFVRQNEGVWLLPVPDSSRRINWRCPRGAETSVVGGKASSVRDATLIEKPDKTHWNLRSLPYAQGEPGCHFTYLAMNADQLRQKLSAFSHSEFDRPEVSHPGVLSLADTCIIDHLGRIQTRGSGLLEPFAEGEGPSIIQAAAAWDSSWVGSICVPNGKIRRAGAALIFGIVQRGRLGQIEHLPMPGDSAEAWWGSLSWTTKVQLQIQQIEGFLLRIWIWLRSSKLRD